MMNLVSERITVMLKICNEFLQFQYGEPSVAGITEVIYDGGISVSVSQLLSIYEATIVYSMSSKEENPNCQIDWNANYHEN